MTAATETTDLQRRNTELADTLHRRNADIARLTQQLTAVTTERDDYRSKFRDLEHELQLERGQVVLMTERKEAAEAVLASIPMAPLLRFVEAILMRGQPLQFDVDAVERWLQADGRKVPSLAEIREKFGHHFDAIEDVDEWVRQQRRGE